MATHNITLPYRLEPFGGRGYTASVMSAKDAAEFVTANPQAAMPCWKRFDIIGGLLIQTR